LAGGIYIIASIQTDNDKVNIICSRQDPASQNIKNNLLKIKEWKPLDFKCSDVLNVYEYNNFRLVEIDSMHIYQDGLDIRLAECGFDSHIMIFASKHRSNDGRHILTVHYTGNTKEAKFGGHPMELAVAAPKVMRMVFNNLKILTNNEKFEVSIESTHHGPSDLSIPSLFVEIGSSQTEWVNSTAGRIVADAILISCRFPDNEDIPIAVGFGGNHYATRQNKLIEETTIAFGHIFPSYKLDELNDQIIKQAFECSNADFAYFDRKSMSAKQRERLYRIIEELGYEILRETDIREMDRIPWQIYKQFKKKVNEITPSGRMRITNHIKDEIKNYHHTRKYLTINLAAISHELLREAEKFDRNRIEAFLKGKKIVYVEHNDGRLLNIIVGIDKKYADLVMKKLMNECINILKEHYDIRYVKDEGVLYLTGRKFSPDLAKKLGITSGPQFGALTRGETVTIDKKVISPEMVYVITERVIRVKNTC